MGEWKHGLLGCFTNPGICCLATFAFPLLAGKNAEAIGENATFWAIVAWSPCAAALLRGQIRKKKGIDGKLWQDLLCYCCLPCCTIGQEAMELESVDYLLDDEDLNKAQKATEDIART